MDYYGTVIILLILISFQAEAKFSNYREAAQSVKGVDHAVSLAQNWLLVQVNDRDGWNDSFTPNAITALSLSSKDCDASVVTPLMIKEMELELALMLTRHYSTLSVTSGDIAEYIIALSSLCMDPQNFHGINLISTMKRYRIKNDLEYATVCLALCISGHELSKAKVKHLTEILRNQNNNIEVRTLAYLSLSCDVNDNNCFITNGHEFLKLLKKSQENGTFENLYSTALISQAFIAKQNYDEDFKFHKTLEYLLENQMENGSFGNVTTTYYLLPVLSGHSLADLKAWNCSCEDFETSEFKSDGLEDEEVNVTFSLWEGLLENNNSTSIDFSISLPIFSNATVFDMMNKAQQLDPRFSFSTRTYDEFGHFVTELAGRGNDYENGTYWMLYIQNPQTSKPKFAIKGISQLRLRHNDHFIFWYRKVKHEPE